MALTLASAAAAAVQFDCTVTQTRGGQPYGVPIRETIRVARLDDRRVGNVHVAYQQGERRWANEGALVNAGGEGAARVMELFVVGPVRIAGGRYSGWHMLTDGAGRIEESGTCALASEGTGR